ncbi:MAG: aminotransferase class V-fold PLP-dependent enzyme [Candidatus Aminicenantes bacterium]|nr:aminotransferase class V-fold PLP-dependent enzyme [Candidatus Aminicenantes bacterium]
MRRVYMDHIAGTPLHPAVIEAMLPFLKEHYANPQSLHSFGQESAQGIDEARENVARLINADPDEIFFTSSGTESNNFAVKGIASAQRSKGMHLVLSAVEHQSILHSAQSLEKSGFKVTRVPVDKYGLVDPFEVKKAIADETSLVSVMWANGEVGTIEPVDEVAEICREKGVVFHTDAIDAVGNIPVDVKKSGVDALSLAGNQFYGPSGSAALYLKKGTRCLPFIDGGIQENGKRAGAENLAGIVGMGKAAEIALQKLSIRADKIKPLRDSLVERLPQMVAHVILTGHPEKRLPHHASFCVEFIEGEAMLLNLDMKGIAAASGSACTSRALKASHVLLAMGIDHATAQGSVVFSLIESNTSGDVDYLLDVFPEIIDRLRQMSPLYPK